MSCNCNTTSKSCEPCAFCTPPGVTCLPDCNPPDPCEEKIDLCCVNFSGESQECANIQTGESLCDLIETFYEATTKPEIFCQLELTINLLSQDPKTLLLTLNNTGGDQGPFELFTIDDLNVVTPIPGIFTYTQLTQSYQIEVENNIVGIRIQSITEKCGDYYIDIEIPVPMSPRVFQTIINQADLDDSTGNVLHPNNAIIVEYIDSVDPEAGLQYRTYEISGSFFTDFCSFEMPSIYYYKDDIKIEIILSSIIEIGDCPYY